MPSNYPPGVTGNEPQIAGDLEEQTEDQRVGATLRKLRELRGFKVAEFADRIGVTRSQLANLEAGRRVLSDVYLARCADVLKVPQIAIRIPGPIPTYVDEGDEWQGDAPDWSSS